MLLDAVAAKALFAIIMVSTQRTDIKPQLPLQVVDRGDSWLVKGTPYTSTKPRSNYCMTYMFFKKDSAEVIGILSQARFDPEEVGSDYWHKITTPEQYARVFGPPTEFEPNGILDIYFALYGGLVNTPADAIDYAFVLLQTNAALTGIPKRTLQATERDKVWHITTKSGAIEKELLSLSRSDGKVLSGDL